MVTPSRDKHFVTPHTPPSHDKLGLTCRNNSPTHQIYKINVNITWVSHIFMKCDLIWTDHIGTISNTYCERMWFLESENNINFIFIFLYKQILILEDGNNIYLIFYFSHIFKNCILINLLELLFNSNSDLKFSCSI